MEYDFTLSLYFILSYNKTNYIYILSQKSKIIEIVPNDITFHLSSLYQGLYAPDSQKINHQVSKRSHFCLFSSTAPKRES